MLKGCCGVHRIGLVRLGLRGIGGGVGVRVRARVGFGFGFVFVSVFVCVLIFRAGVGKLPAPRRAKP